MEMWGAFAFGTVLGWFLYFTNRYRKADTQLSDVATLIGVVGGSAITALFGDAKTTLFGAYGIGLAVGFFAYFLALLVMVRMSRGVFTVNWFLDGRRRRLKPNEFIPEGTRVTAAPMSAPRRGPMAAHAPAPADAESALDVMEERDAAIAAANDGLRAIRVRLDSEKDPAERTKLFDAEGELNGKLEDLIALRIRASLDSEEVHAALAELSQITDEMKEGAAEMRTTAEALAKAATLIALASRVIALVGAFA